MKYWSRELAGWMLVAIGLLIFIGVFTLCQRRQITEAGVMAVVGVFVFRGGIHLLKVAIAAHICDQAQERLYPATPSVTVRPAPTKRLTVSRSSRAT